ncbi:MAG: DegV family protein [Defluviitaleaceae bacterium]|nr:DegV family protein [Defluviitaleaceae bacterium]
MALFQLISDGGCDFTAQEAAQHNVQIVPFYVTLDQQTHLKEGVDITKDEYYKRLKAEKNLYPKTAQPSPQDYIDVYTPYLQASSDIISLTISSKLSGTYNSATLAATMLKEDFPDRTIVVVDSLNASVGQGLILRDLIKMRDAGHSLAKAVEIAEKIVPTVRTYFTLESLEYLRRGGRVGPTTALVGGILGLRPILHLVDGSVEQADSVRGSKKMLKLIAEGVVDAVKDDLHNLNIGVGHIQSLDDARTVKAHIEEALDITITNPVGEVGVTIGTHTGPGALVVTYCKKYTSFTN